MKVCGLIAAGGIGKRFGAERPKQFLYLRGKPVIAWSIEAFQQVPYCEELVIVVPDGWQETVEGIAKEFCRNIGYKIVVGGASRAGSVLNGLKAVRSDVEWVAVHDAARPGIYPQQIEEAILLSREVGASIVAMKAIDTIKIVDNSGLVIKTIPRSDVYLAQTPQVARIADLLRAFSEDEIYFLNATDESSILERIGIPVGIVEGGINNLKITRPEDLKILEAVL